MSLQLVESLGDFIRRIRKEQRLSLADVSDRSARFGKRITPSYINRIENEQARNVTVDRAIALAHGLGVPVHELPARVVGVPSSMFTDGVELLAKFNELSPERQADVLSIMEVLRR